MSSRCGDPVPAETALVEVTAALRAARSAAQQGDFVDLTGLDQVIAGICAGIRAMPSAQGRALAPQLADLTAELEALAAAMSTQRDRLLGMGEAGGVASPAGAAAAYRKHRS